MKNPPGYIFDPFPMLFVWIGKFSYERHKEYLSIFKNSFWLPHLDSPKNYKWPVNNCEVYLIDCGKSQESFIKFCAKCFLSQGAHKVQCFFDKKVFVFNRSC